MKITIKTLLNCPPSYVLCPNCEKINWCLNKNCITCSHPLTYGLKKLTKKDLAGFQTVIGDESENITIEV